MIVSDFSKKFNPKIRDLHNDLGILFRYDKKISDQYSFDNDCISIVQNRFQLININRVINYRNNLSDRNFDIRKTLIKFDDVMNDQRQVIFGQRIKILESNDSSELIFSFLEVLGCQYLN